MNSKAALSLNKKINALFWKTLFLTVSHKNEPD